MGWSVLCPPDCSWVAATCTSEITCGIGCPMRKCPALAGQVSGEAGRCTESIETFRARQLSYIWANTPPAHLVEDVDRRSGLRRLILITVSFPHPLQLLKLEHCGRALAHAKLTSEVLWIVVEDAAEPSANVSHLLGRLDTPHRHMAVGPSRRGGNMQRDAALRYIRDAALDGVVYNMDDDNGFHPSLWGELADGSLHRPFIMLHSYHEPFIINHSL